MNIRGKVTKIFFIILTLMMLSGCAPAEKVYDTFSALEMTDEELELLSEGKLSFKYEKEDFPSITEYIKYQAYLYIKQGNRFLKNNAVVYMIGSIVIGMVIMMLARKAIKVRRMALFVFILGIPVIIFALIYGTAIIADLLG